MSMYGADADVLERIGAQLEQAGIRLASGGRRLGSALDAAPWRGQGADRFRREFHSVHARTLAEAVAFLDTARETLLRNAQEQRDASDRSSTGRPIAGVTLRRPGSSGGPTGEELAKFVAELLDGGLDLAGALKDLNVIKVGSKIGAAAGVAGILFGLHDAFLDHPYEGNFNIVETTSDVLGMIGGAMMMTPIPHMWVAGAVVVGLTSAIDLGLSVWTNGGREQFRAASDWVEQRWDATTDMVGDFASESWHAISDVVDNGWEQVTDAGQRFADTASDVFDRITPW